MGDLDRPPIGAVDGHRLQLIVGSLDLGDELAAALGSCGYPG